jgi:hypothetical protein
LCLDAGEVHTAQGHHDFMAVQGGFQGDADRSLWQCRDCLTLGLCLGLLGWWLANTLAGMVKLF